MSYLVWLVPIALGMGILGLAAFLWSMRAGQYEDLDGAAERVLLAEASDTPLREGIRNGEDGRHRPAATGTREEPTTFIRNRTREKRQNDRGC